MAFEQQSGQTVEDHTRCVALRAQPRPPSRFGTYQPRRPGRRDQQWRAVMLALPRLKSAAIRYSSSESDADDLLHDTAERALRGIDRFVEGTNLMAWLRTILVRIAIDGGRRRKHQRRVYDDFLSLVNSEFAQAAEPDEQPAVGDIHDVHAAAQTLPEPIRTTFRQSVIERLSHQQISLKEGIAVKTVATRLWRARRQLRRLMVGQEVKGADPRPRDRRPGQ